MRTSNRLSALFTLIATVLISGCVPYPVYKTLQPAATATVRDQARQPLEKAEVTLISSAYPYGFEQHRQVRQTLADGTAAFDAMREMRVEVMALHGSQEFFWNWCVRKEGYATFVTHHRGATDFQASLLVQLEPGTSSPCPAYNGLQPNSGTNGKTSSAQ